MKVTLLLLCLAGGLATASLTPASSELKQSCRAQLEGAGAGEYLS
jgi:hypothetical protein